MTDTNQTAASGRGTGLDSMLLPELKKVASSLRIKGAGGMRKAELLAAIGGARSAPAPAQATRTPASAEKIERAAAPESVGVERPARSRRERPANQEAMVEAGPAREPRDDVASRLDALAHEGGRRGRRPRSEGESAGLGEATSRQDRQQDRPQSTDRQQSQQSTDRQQSQQDRQQDRQQGQQDRQQQDRQQNDSDDDYGPGGRRNRRRRNRERPNRRTPRNAAGASIERFEAEPVIAEDDVLVSISGILDVLDNYAFVRTTGYLPGPNDAYVSLSMVKRFGLRKGDIVTGALRAPRDADRKEKFNPLVRIDTVNGDDPENAKDRVEFNKLTPLYPQDRLRLETSQTNMTGRIIDLVAPIGKGQRGLIVSPPKAGKTMVLQNIANAITQNNPEVHLMVVLVDERPEEVTDFQRSVKGEVIASTFDRPADDHTTIAELAIERAKRLVELGHDVVILLDGITRLSRAYNLAAPASGRILSGGVDSAALYPPKRFFGAARNVEGGGSLTILATALVETGSKMDEVIFEEFKGTGNMELRLRRELADKRIFPAIDPVGSGTRREEQLMGREELAIIWKLRRVLSGLDDQQALEMLINRMKKTQTNLEFLHVISRTTPSSE